MEDIIKQTRDNVEAFLREDMEHQNKSIDYLLVNPETKETITLASDGGEEIIQFAPYTTKENGYENGYMNRESVVMPGVRIGDGAIVAAYSVVTKDVAPYTVVGGNPARFLKNRFDSQLTQLLLEAQWWDWEPQALAQAVPMLCSPDLEAVKSWLRGLGYGAACT